MTADYVEPAAATRAESVLSSDEYRKYLPIVRRTAMRVARRLPRHISVADVMSYGWVGLLEAKRRASAEMNDDEFEAYALYRIRGAILDHLRALDPRTRRSRATSRKIARGIAELSSKLQRPPEEFEIAAHLGMSEDDYRQALVELDRAGMTRIELLDLDRLDALDNEAELPEESASRREEAAAVAGAIKTLPERLQHVLSLYYNEECTLREIGAILEVSEARACQLRAEAVHRIRAALGKE